MGYVQEETMVATYAAIREIATVLKTGIPQEWGARR